MNSPLSQLNHAQTQEALVRRALYAWSFDKNAISRTLKTRDWRATMMVANAIGYLCETAWHHPQLTLAYSQIVIRLDTHDVGGVSMRDIELAGQIEAWLAWNGAGEGKALEGLPTNARLIV
jgi:4a-hydroxytetrahydrobiopterin dehydratase